MSTDTPNTLSVKELLQKQFPPGQFIVSDGLLNRGSILVVGGPPKSYKSIVTGTMICHIATGTPLFGAYRTPRGDRREDVFRVDSPRTVLYMEQEIGEEDLQHRFCCQLSQLSAQQQEMCQEFIYVHSCNRDLRLDTMLGTREIRDAILAAGKPDIVVFDPLIEFHQGDENSASEMSAMLHNLDALRAEFGFATILNHHTSKPNGENGRHGPDRLRGSSVLYGKADSVMLLDPDGKQRTLVRSEFTLRRAKPIDDLWLTIDEFSLTAKFVSFRHVPELVGSRGREKRPGASLAKAAKNVQ